MSKIQLSKNFIRNACKLALAEDLYPSGDITSNLIDNNISKKVMMVTECSMSDNVQIDNPKVEFIRPCNLCPHMKKITLPKILNCLENETNELIMDKDTIEKARKSVERMTEIGR